MASLQLPVGHLKMMPTTPLEVVGRCWAGARWEGAGRGARGAGTSWAPLQKHRRPTPRVSAGLGQGGGRSVESVQVRMDLRSFSWRFFRNSFLKSL